MEVLKQLQSGQKLVVELNYPDYSAISAQVVSVDGVELQSGSPAVATWSATLAAAAGQGQEDPDVLTVTSATGVLPGVAFLEDPGGHWEKIKIVSVDTANKKLYLADSLNVGYDATATVKPATATLDYNSAVTGTEQRFWVSVSYLRGVGKVDGWKLSGYTHRSPALCPINESHVLDMWPQIADMEFNRQPAKTLQNIIDNVFNRVRSDLWSRGQTVEMYKGAVESLQQYLLYEVAWALSETGINPLTEGTVADFQEAITQTRNTVASNFLNTQQWVDKDDSDTQSAYERNTGIRIVW